MSLTCESTQIKIMDRGGVTALFDVVSFETLKYTRVRDDISECSFLARPDGPDCAANFALIEAGRHEVLILRNGQRIWEGPVTLASFSRGELKVQARDCWHYVYRTILRSAYNNAYPRIDYATERVRDILETELGRGWEAITPPIGVLEHLDIRTNTETARTSLNTVEYEKTAWEEIDNMAAHSGIDYTAIGRRLMVFDTHDIIGRTVQLTDGDFDGDLVVTQYGMNLCTYSAVTDGMGNWSATLVDDDYYGPWEMLETTYGVQDTMQCAAEGAEEAALEEMHEQTVRNLANRYPTPVVVRVPDNSRLSPDCGLTIDDLVPGIRIPLATVQTGRPVRQEQKLDNVTFSLEGGQEIITVTLSPAPTGVTVDADGTGDSGASTGGGGGDTGGGDGTGGGTGGGGTGGGGAGGDIDPETDPEPERLLSRQNIAVIGDGRIADEAAALRTALVAAGYGDGNVWIYGVTGKTTAAADTNSKTLATNIADARNYFGGDPDAWVIAVGSASAGGTVPSELTQPLLAVQNNYDRRLLWLSHSASAFNTAAAPLVNAKKNAAFLTTTDTGSALVDYIVDAVGPPVTGADGGWTKAQLLDTPARAGSTITVGSTTWNTVTYEATYVSGDTFQQTLNRVTGGKVLTLPEGVFEIADFTNGFNDGVRIGSGGATGCVGIAGSGRNTIIRLTGSGSSGGNIIGVDRLGAGPAYFGNFQLQANDRSAVGWTGMFIANAPGTVCEWLFLNGAFKGYANYPPGETFGINIYKCNDAVIQDCEVDGRNRTSRVRQGASPFGWNGTAGDYVQDALVQRTYCHHGLAGMGTFWQTNNVTLNQYHSWSCGSGPGSLSGSQINLEEVTGQVRINHCRLYAYGQYYKNTGWSADPYATGNVDFNFAQASTIANMTDIIVTEPRFDVGVNGLMTVTNYNGYQNSTTGVYNVITSQPTIVKNGVTLMGYNHTSIPGTANIDTSFAWVR